MTNLPTIRKFTGQVPNKETMDKDTFANSVHTYLNYFNDVFVPDTQDFTDKMNTLEGELDDFLNDANDLVNQADSIRTDVTNLKDETIQYKTLAKNYANADKNVEVETGLYSAKHYSLISQDYQILAKNYANADEDVEVESGYYSAKHYMLKTQAIMDNAVAQLPEGTIDDSAIGDDITWSSQKIDNELKSMLTKMGTIDGGNATTSVDAVIDGGGAN